MTRYEQQDILKIGDRIRTIRLLPWYRRADTNNIVEVERERSEVPIGNIGVVKNTRTIKLSPSDLIFEIRFSNYGIFNVPASYVKKIKE